MRPKLKTIEDWNARKNNGDLHVYCARSLISHVSQTKQGLGVKLKGLRKAF